MSQPSPVAEQQQTILLRRLEEELRQQQSEISGRRAMTRYPFNALVSLAAPSADGPEKVIGEAWALDFSRRGIGLLTDRSFAAGEELTVTFRASRGEEASARLHVVYCKRLFGSIFRLGGQFMP
jgi:hypothetical protein